MLLLLSLLMFITLFYLSFKNYLWGIYLVILCFPLNNRILFDVGIDRIIPTRLAVTALVIAFLLRELKTFIVKGPKTYLTNQRSKFSRDDYLFILLLLLGVRVLSLINSLNLNSSLVFISFYLTMVISYLVLKEVVAVYGKEIIVKLYKFHVVIVTLTGVFSLVQFVAFQYFGKTMPGVWPSPTEPTRYGSLFWDINHYSPYLLTVLPYLFLMLIYDTRRKYRLIYLSAFIFNNLILLMTLSRSGWLGYAFSLLILGLILLLKRMKRGLWVYGAMILLMLVGSIVGSIYFNIPIYQRLNTLTGEVYNESFIAHKIIMRGNLAVWTNHPVLGGGYGSFNEQFRKTDYAKPYFELDKIGDTRLPAHSALLEPLSETGMAGFFIFISLFFVLIRHLYLNVSNITDVHTRILNLAMVTSIAGIAFSGLFYSYNLEYIWFFIFFAIFIARLGSFEKINLKNYLLYYGLVLLSVGTILPGLGDRALIDWDESIYAKVSKNIYDSGDYLTLRWHPTKYWFEKPPLYFWFTTLFYKIYGVSEYSARFTSSLAGILGVILTYVYGARVYKSKWVGLYASLILLSTVHWLFQSRNGTLDVLMATLILVSLLCFWQARSNPKLWKWTGLWLGLSLLTKGAVVIIPLSIMITFALIEIFLYKKRQYYPLKNIVIMGVVFLLVILPWHIALYAIHREEFIHSYLIYHVFERSKGIEGHGMPFFWYFTVIRVWFRQNALLLIPASLFLLGKILLDFKRSWGGRKREKLPDARDLFLFIWAGLTFIILSLSVSKIQWYILPIYPALALIIGRALEMVVNKRGLKLKLGILILLIVAVPLFKEIYRPMWDIEDSWRGVAEVTKQLKKELRKNTEVTLMIVDMSPGPAMFYADYATTTATYSGLVNSAESNEAFFAVARIGQAEQLIEDYPDRGIVIWKIYDDFALFGSKN